MKLEIRKPEDFDIPQILKIFAENDPDRATFFNQEYYEWQFRCIPGEAKALIASEKDRIIAFGALLPFKASVRGKVCTVFEGVEFVVLPEFRRRGIFTKLASSLYGQINNKNHAFAFASPMSFGMYQHRLEHSFIGYFPYWIGIVNFQALIQKKVRPLSFLKKPFCKLIELKPLKYNNGMVIESVNNLDKSWDIVETWKYKSDFYLKKNAAYLNWRYISHPYHKYDIYGIYRNGQPVGYVVIRGQNLIDLAYSDNETLKCLLNKAIDYFREKEVLVANTYLSLDTEGVKILKNMRFWKSNACQGKFTKNILYPVQRTMIKHKSNAETFPNLNSWTFTMGDVDCKL